MSIRTPLAVAVLVTVFLGRPGMVEAVTVKEIVDLSRAGMSDEVVIALIKADQTIFNLAAADLVALKNAGVSQRILLAMLQSGRDPDAPAPARSMAPEPPPAYVQPVAPSQVPLVAPTVVVIESRSDERWSVPFFFVPTPIFGVRDHTRRFALPAAVPVDTPGFGRFINDGWRPAQTAPPPAAPPVYWGWDGKLRPGAWQPN